MAIYDPMDHENSILRFSEEVERIARSGRGMRIIDAILAVAGKENMEPQFAATLLTPTLRDKLQDDAEKHHMVKKSARLRFT
jgi:hypothetical protein